MRATLLLQERGPASGVGASRPLEGSVHIRDSQLEWFAQSRCKKTMVFILLAAAVVRANVYWWAHERLLPDQIRYRRVGMWAGKDVAESASASVQVSLRFQRPSSAAARAGIVQLLAFHSSVLMQLGTEHEERARRPAAFCCTAELKQHPGCDHPGHLILRREHDKSDALHVQNVVFGVNQSAAAVTEKWHVQRSGMWYLLVSSCDPRTGEVVISGESSWANPHGALPGELYGFIPFFRTLCLAYVVAGAAWLALCYRHRSVLLPLQLCIGGVLALSLLESSTWYYEYTSFNASGSRRGAGLVVLGVLISTVRKTVARLLVLAVCLGYGVVRMTLGVTAYRVLALGVVYFLFSALLDVRAPRRAAPPVAHARAPAPARRSRRTRRTRPSSRCRCGCSSSSPSPSSTQASTGGSSPPSRARSPSWPRAGRRPSCSSTAASRTCSPRQSSSPRCGPPSRCSRLSATTWTSTGPRSGRSTPAGTCSTSPCS
jgi:hypothetical protein